MSNTVLDYIITIVEQEAKDVHSSFDADELGEMLSYLNSLKDTYNHFSNFNNIKKFVVEQMEQMTDAEKGYYNSLDKDLLMRCAFFDGFLNGLVQLGFDMNTVSEEVSKEELDEYYKGEKEL